MYVDQTGAHCRLESARSGVTVPRSDLAYEHAPLGLAEAANLARRGATSRSSRPLIYPTSFLDVLLPTDAHSIHWCFRQTPNALGKHGLVSIDLTMERAIFGAAMEAIVQRLARAGGLQGLFYSISQLLRSSHLLSAFCFIRARSKTAPHSLLLPGDMPHP